MRNKIISAIVVVLVLIASLYLFQNFRALSEEKIINLVENLPEVREFKKTVEESENNGQFMIRIAGSPDEESPYYLVQVAEILNNHTATFAWYNFDPETKTVKKEEL